MDHPPRARARLPLVLFILAFLSLFVIFFGSDKARSGSIARITHKFDSGLTTLVMVGLCSTTRNLLFPMNGGSSMKRPDSQKPTRFIIFSENLYRKYRMLVKTYTRTHCKTFLDPPLPMMKFVENALEVPLRRVDDLEEALAGAATRYKTVILTMVNKAYVEGEKAMLDIFLDGFWMGEGTRPLVNHLLIIAVDQTAYERCMFLRLHCYKMKTDGVDFVGEKMYMSDDFIKMMWQRTRILGDVLRRGYNFIFTLVADGWKLIAGSY
ncbi:putative nucleotide-diphospho-sugar transferase [Helianthus debilis subsp. tardiflorus]